MTIFSDALKKAGIVPNENEGYDKKKAGSFILEMKLYEMQNHISAMKRIYEKYLHAEGEDKFDYMDSLANRYGYMVIAFQDIMATIMKLEGNLKKVEDISIRRAISEFQSIFEAECREERLDDAISSLSDRNEVVHMYENYKGNMETVLGNVQNYRNEYETIWKLIWRYSETNGILQK